MLWIRYRQGENIPSQLYYYRWQTDRDVNGRTPIMMTLLYPRGVADYGRPF